MLKTRQQIGGLGNLMFKEAYLYARMKEGVIPDIYVQSKRYWESFASEIKQLFSAGIGHTNMVSLQIRRGDYVGNPFYLDITETGYYERAVSLFPNDSFLVFCHDNQDPEQDKADKEWCRNFLDKIIPGRYVMNEPKSETEDLNKMASCRHNIIANSSFGWWAGFLNPNPDKKVIAPKEWFSDGIERCELPEEFTKI